MQRCCAPRDQPKPRSAHAGAWGPKATPKAAGGCCLEAPGCAIPCRFSTTARGGQRRAAYSRGGGACQANMLTGSPPGPCAYGGPGSAAGDRRKRTFTKLAATLSLGSHDAEEESGPGGRCCTPPRSLALRRQQGVDSRRNWRGARAVTNGVPTKSTRRAESGRPRERRGRVQDNKGT